MLVAEAKSLSTSPCNSALSSWRDKFDFDSLPGQLLKAELHGDVDRLFASATNISVLLPY